MECQNIIENYLNYLKKDLRELRNESQCNIDLPFPKPDGDSVAISIVKKGSNYLISDNGFMDEYLFLNGLDLWDLPDKPNDIFLHLRRTYKIKSNRKPEIVIEANPNDLYLKIYQLSNVINELSSLRLLTTPVAFSYFKASIRIYLDNHSVRYKINPKKFEFKYHKNPFSFQMDFLFYKNNAYAKLISSDSIIKDWAMRFVKLRRYYKLMGKSIKLWVIYNDKDGVKSKEINRWFEEDSDNSFGWYSERENIVSLI